MEDRTSKPWEASSHKFEGKLSGSEYRINLFAHRRAVLSYIKATGEYGATDSEIRKALGIGEVNERGRVVELFALGKIKKGEREGSWIIA